MKKWLLFITILLLCSSVARADVFKDGAEAQYKDNYAQALEILRPIAEEGNAEAQVALGQMYAKGQGVTRNYQEVLKWFRLAAAQGNVEAQFRLGAMYAKGKGVTQDYQEAVKWFRILAAQGNAQGQYKLGLMYRGGQGVTQDNVHAHMWFSLAENQGVRAAKKKRVRIAIVMTPSQIVDAQRMARDCVEKHYRNCE
ncbi:MAG: sel1 repeat family protein [Betaproteobacteria bacterium]|nr:MAG: sel1 repeat family protein [Betaproteobacteria bacterium]